MTEDEEERSDLISVMDLTYWLTHEMYEHKKMMDSLENRVHSVGNTKEDIEILEGDITEQMAIIHTFDRIMDYINGYQKDKPTYYKGRVRD